ncbi:Myosin-I heavy chain [Phytophthora cinnamomi]|uniref:Myosin-I heavy chain n=1 Tax=Phytophthora cinnamomi TaxID=4785 RepID=UPI0035595B88|nr:Myosin-I heavy chain [Phytophthora cinnamomi]
MDLRDFITHNDVSDLEIRGSVRVQARLLWTVKKTVHTFRFLRVYLGKRTELEPLHEQQTIYREAQHDNPYEVNQSHITLLLYDIAAENPNLPKPGDIISFDPPSYASIAIAAR